MKKEIEKEYVVFSLYSFFELNFSELDNANLDFSFCCPPKNLQMNRTVF